MVKRYSNIACHQLFLENWGYLHGLIGGFGACSHEQILKNDAIWCVLENICQNFVKIFEKIFIFYIKIIKNLLLRTIFKGIGAYTPQLVVQFGVLWTLEYIF